MVKAAYGVQNERGEGGSEGGAHCEFVGGLNGFGEASVTANQPRGSPDRSGDEDDGGGVLLLLELRASTRRGREGWQSSGIRWLDEGVSVATVDGDGGDGRARWA